MDTTKIKPRNLDDQVHPDLKDYLSKVPSMDITRENVTEVREKLAALYKSLPKKTYEGVETTSRKIPGPEGAPEVEVHISQPKERKGTLPAIMCIHGGGLTLGNVEATDSICQLMALQVNCVVISIGYRKAPEDPFPASLEDCYAGLVWIKNSAKELDIDPKRIGVFGMSAGGNLCLGVALLARDRKGPEICFQAPLCPMIDDRNQTHSSYEITDGRVWNRQKNIDAWKMYLGDQYGKEVSPYAAPARATDLSGLPPAYITVPDLDIFRDEVIDFVKRLSQAEVPVEFHIHKGCIHGFEHLAPNSSVSQESAKALLKALKTALNP